MWISYLGTFICTLSAYDVYEEKNVVLFTSPTTSKLQWFSHIANHAAAIWILKAFDPSEYIKLSPLK